MSSESTPGAALDRIEIAGRPAIAEITACGYDFDGSCEQCKSDTKSVLAAVLPALADELQRWCDVQPGWEWGWDHAIEYLRSLAAPADDQEASDG